MIKGIVAVDRNWAIGKVNKETGIGQLLFNIPEDLKYFKEKTNHNIVVMGYSTYLSLPKKPLPNRVNVVLWDKAQLPVETKDGAIFFNNFEALLSFVKILSKEYDVFICGGASVYRLFLPYYDEVLVTKVDAEDKEATAFFPCLDESESYYLDKELSSGISNGLHYTFLVYSNRNKLADTLSTDHNKIHITNFDSAEFEAILSTINEVLAKHNIMPLTYNMVDVKLSKYDTDGKFGNKSIWRITSVQNKNLFGYSLLQELKAAVTEAFPEYVKDRTIKIGAFKDTNGVYQNSIVIVVGNLKDNTWTRQDLELYGKDQEVTTRLNELEKRMFRRQGDTRTTEERWNDFLWTTVYESKLLETPMKDVDNLVLVHNNDVFSIDPDLNTDFIGTVKNVANCKVEGKSSWEPFEYIDTVAGRAAFAKHFADIASNLGSFHDADYILFVNKSTETVICINKNDYFDNWFAGNIKLV